MKKQLKIFFLFIMASAMASTLSAQTNFIREKFNPETVEDSVKLDSVIIVDSLVADTTIFVEDLKFPKRVFGNMVYTPYQIKNGPNFFEEFSESKTEPWLNWIIRQKRLQATINQMQQNLFFSNPDIVRYNIATLPEPPKAYTATVDPASAQIVVTELAVDRSKISEAPKPVEQPKIYWLKSIEAGLQFSQAYISPNWYQGGNNNLNMIANAVYNVKLNPAFNKKILFENTFRYKLAMNNAPDDTMHSYNISEDLFQINTNFGVKAVNNWYYSLTGMFKTQLFNNYKKNTRTMKAAFMSPGELNLGVGMTYSYTNLKKTVSFNASIAPLSYNLKICTNNEVNETAFGIEEGKTTASQYGSNVECKFEWKVTHNITYKSRLYAFSDYEYIQGDWENTVSCAVNKYLSTQIYVHLRYDSTTPRTDNPDWHKLQLKEILSFGLAYKFSIP